jgi:DnaA N-terminal domain
MNAWLILDGHGGEAGVFVRPSLVRLCRGNASAAILLAQFIYWQKRTKNEERWFYNTGLVLEEQTGLSEAVQATARASLIALGVLEEEKRGMPRRLHYRLDISKLARFISGEEQPPKDTRDENLRRSTAKLSASRTSRSKSTEPREASLPNAQEQASRTSGNKSPDDTGNKSPEPRGTVSNKETEITTEITTETTSSARENFENSVLKTDEEEVQNSFEGQTPDQNQNLEHHNLDETNQTTVVQPETPRGIENVPPAASETDRARNALTALLSTNPIHKPQLQRITFWLEHHHPRFILALVDAMMTGEGVQKSGFGMLFTALNTIGNKNVPEKLRRLHARLNAGLTDTLERTPGAYTDEAGKIYQVSSWSPGFDALLAGGTHRIPERGTWLWTRTPEHDLKPLPTLEQPGATPDLEVYHPVLMAMQTRVTRTEFDNWLTKAEIVETPEFQILAPNQFHKNWLEQHYKLDFLAVTGLEHVTFGVKGATV